MWVGRGRSGLGGQGVGGVEGGDGWLGVCVGGGVYWGGGVLGGVGIGEPVGEMRVGGVRKFCWAEDPICILWTLEKFSILFRSRGH